jgi:large repetitive protein
MTAPLSGSSPTGMSPSPPTNRRLSKIVVRGLLATAACGAFIAAAGAGTGAQAAPVTANVAVGSQLALSALTPTFTLTGNTGALITGAGSVSFNVDTNSISGYTVTVQGGAATLAPATAGNADSIPIAALTFKEPAAADYAPMSSTAAQTAHTQDVRSAFGGDTTLNDYQILIPFVAADTYTVTLNYLAAVN